MSPPPDGQQGGAPPGAGLFQPGLGTAYHTGWRQENIGPKAGNQPLIHGWCYPCNEDGSEAISYSSTIFLGYHVVPRAADPAADLTTDAPDMRQAFARFRFGSGDQQGIDDEGLEVDLGSALTLPANGTLAADIIYPVDPAPLAGTFQPLITVRASVCIGTRAPQGLTIAARRTIVLGTVNGNGNSSPVFPIPNVFLQNFAGGNWSCSAYFSNTALTVPTVTLTQFYDAAGAVPASVVVIGKTDAATVPIVYGARFFRITNAFADASTNTAVIFPVKM